MRPGLRSNGGAPVSHRYWMIVLGMEAAVGGAGAVVLEQGRIRASIWQRTAPRPVAALMPLVDRALRSAGFKAAALEGIAVAAGPGPYAGVRATVMSGKALAYALGVPLVGVDALDALAAAAGPWVGSVWPTIDARRDRVYAAGYRWDAGRLRTLHPAALLSCADWREAVRVAPRPVLWVGTGPEGLLPEAGVASGGLGCHAGLAAAVATLGSRRLLDGARDDPFALQPHYGSDPRLGPPARSLVPMRDKA